MSKLPPPITHAREPKPSDLPSGTRVRVLDNHGNERAAVTEGAPYRYRVKHVDVYLVRLVDERFPVPLGRVVVACR